MIATDLMSKSYRRNSAQKLQRYPACCVRIVRVHQISQKLENTLIKILFWSISFNITHTSLPRVNITYRILPRIHTVFKSVKHLLPRHINERNTQINALCICTQMS